MILRPRRGGSIWDDPGPPTGCCGAKELETVWVPAKRIRYQKCRVCGKEWNEVSTRLKDKVFVEPYWVAHDQIAVKV